MRYSPLRDDVLIQYFKPDEQTTSGLIIPQSAQRLQNDWTKAYVQAIGPKVYEVEPGDVVWVQGHRSGRKLWDVNDSEYDYLENELFLVSERICIAKQEKE